MISFDMQAERARGNLRSCFIVFASDQGTTAHVVTLPTRAIERLKSAYDGVTFKQLGEAEKVTIRQLFAYVRMNRIENPWPREIAEHIVIEI